MFFQVLFGEQTTKWLHWGLHKNVGAWLFTEHRWLLGDYIFEQPNTATWLRYQESSVTEVLYTASRQLHQWSGAHPGSYVSEVVPILAVNYCLSHLWKGPEQSCFLNLWGSSPLMRKCFHLEEAATQHSSPSLASSSAMSPEPLEVRSFSCISSWALGHCASATVTYC